MHLTNQPSTPGHAAPWLASGGRLWGAQHKQQVLIQGRHSTKCVKATPSHVSVSRRQLLPNMSPPHRHASQPPRQEHSEGMSSSPLPCPHLGPSQRRVLRLPLPCGQLLNTPRQGPLPGWLCTQLPQGLSAAAGCSLPPPLGTALDCPEG
jgi:hypothetical protein